MSQCRVWLHASPLTLLLLVIGSSIALAQVLLVTCMWVTGDMCEVISMHIFKMARLQGPQLTGATLLHKKIQSNARSKANMGALCALNLLKKQRRSSAANSGQKEHSLFSF